MVQVVATFHAEDLEEGDNFLEIVSTGVVNIKSKITGRLVKVYNPKEPYLHQLSEGGKTTRKNAIKAEQNELLEGLGIDTKDSQAIFLSRQAVTAKSAGDAIRSYQELIKAFQKEDIAKPPRHCIHLSDAALQEYIASQIDSDYTPTSEWMMQENIPDNNWEDIQSAHVVDGDTVRTTRVKHVTTDPGKGTDIRKIDNA